MMAGLLLLACLACAYGHDVPSETRVHAFARVEGDRLHVLLRVPLALLLNIDLPKQGPGYIALSQVDAALRRAVQATEHDIAWFEDGRRLTLVDSKARISETADKSFVNFESARQLIAGPPLPTSSYVLWNQGYLDAHLQYGIESVGSSVSIDFQVAPALRDRVTLDLRYALPAGGERAYVLPTAHGPVVLDPRWYQAAWTFAVSGFEHILVGPDHLLFILCLILPYRRIDRNLVVVVSAFTVAHSITLIAAAYGLAPDAVWFTPLVETAIAGSIVYMAIENVLKPSLRRRWFVSAVFGLVHGFGFAFMLESQLQFAGSSLLLSLLAFNVGVEVGQLAVLAVLLPVVTAWHSWRPEAGRAAVVVTCAVAAHVAWHWMTERYAVFETAVNAQQKWMVLATGALVVLGAVLWASRPARSARHVATSTREP
ncbi:MAG: HupE/UreJ family protein [Parazoarcus communis]